MKSFAEIDQDNNGNYLNLLSAISKLSGLFSESAVPFINYRVAENKESDFTIDIMKTDSYHEFWK